MMPPFKPNSFACCLWKTHSGHGRWWIFAY